MRVLAFAIIALLQGLLPPLFKKLNNRQVPIYSTLITGAVSG